jgi:hypothetical protein
VVVQKEKTGEEEEPEEANLEESAASTSWGRPSRSSLPVEVRYNMTKLDTKSYVRKRINTPLHTMQNQ